jgi:hypothetical protein
LVHLLFLTRRIDGSDGSPSRDHRGAGLAPQRWCVVTMTSSDKIEVKSAGKSSEETITL